MKDPDVAMMRYIFARAPEREIKGFDLENRTIPTRSRPLMFQIFGVFLMRPMQRDD